MDIKRFLIDENLNILNALDHLNSFKKEDDLSRLVLFVLSKDKVIGSITDGDIRRHLIKEKNLNSKVRDVCNHDFLYLDEFSGYCNLNKYRDANILILPVLNKDKTISRIIDLDKTRSELPIDCLLMAGGRGKRLSPLTDEIPKPLLKLANKPIIEYNIDRLIEFGVRKIQISLGYLGEQIQDYFGDGSSKDIEISYIKETKPLGTAGALSLIEKLNHQHILLMNGDLYTNVDFESMYLNLIKSDSEMILASRNYKVDVPYGVFSTDGNELREFNEKPSYNYNVNAGIYILSKSSLNQIPKDTYYDINELINYRLENKAKLTNYPINGYWIDIGNPEDYKSAQDLINYSKL